jgi:hypothetical protein
MKSGLWAVGALALALSGSARADVIAFDLIGGNSSISGYTGPYDHVVVDLTDSTHATITFTSLTNSGNIYLMGDGGTVGVNVNAGSWTVSGLTSSNAGTGFSSSQIADAGAKNEDGWGSFNQTFDSFDGFTHSSDTVSFTLTDTSGSWASASHVLVANAQNAVAETHVFVTSDPANTQNSNPSTGYAAGAGPSGAPIPGPLPASAWGGLALLGLLAARKFRVGHAA